MSWWTGIGGRSLDSSPGWPKPAGLECFLVQPAKWLAFSGRIIVMDLEHVLAELRKERDAFEQDHP
jgi:hypothetical protein